MVGTRTSRAVSPSGSEALAAAPPDRQYITVREAAELSTLSQVSIRRFLSQKKLRHFKLFGRTLINRAELLGLIHEVA